MSDQPSYVMSISLNALNHLGINLYSNVPAVLSELVANAYDANATEVHIGITPDLITIKDNGDGMSQAEINERYLTIGYDRRKYQPGPTKMKRAPMGRKGIGKLAVFSIADIVEVYSAKNGDRNGLQMSRSAIEQLIADKQDQNHSYHPVAIPTDHIDFEHGTLLVLNDLRRKRITTLTDIYVKRRLARRFTVIGARHNFRIFVNSQEVTARDREFYSSLEFIWFFGRVDPEIVSECKNVKKTAILSDVVEGADNYRVTGWIGTVGAPSQLGERAEEGNSIVVFARGKLVQENILPELREARVFAQYLVGDVEADFIDMDGQDDLATSDRQRLVADDPRYRSLRKLIDGAIKAIGLQWTDLRREEGSQRALANPVIDKWYGQLSNDNQRYARQLFGKIESLPIADTHTKGELYKATILAFEKMALTGHLSALVDIDTSEGLEALLALFQSVDDIEAAHYHEISRGRLEVIHAFQDLVDASSKERVLQNYLFNHLWLLDASWERATNSGRMEQSVKTEFDAVTADLTEDERKGRIDIRFSTVAGKHVIVEMKKYDVLVDVHDLAKQVEKYRSALQKALTKYYPDQPQLHIEIVCVLGSAPTGSDPDRVNKTLEVHNARFVTYDGLIDSAQAAYADYLDRDKVVSSLAQMLAELDQSFASTNYSSVSDTGSR